MGFLMLANDLNPSGGDTGDLATGDLQRNNIELCIVQRVAPGWLLALCKHSYQQHPEPGCVTLCVPGAVLSSAVPLQEGCAELPTGGFFPSSVLVVRTKQSANPCSPLLPSHLLETLF